MTKDEKLEQLVKAIKESAARQAYADSVIDEILRERGLDKPGGIINDSPDKTDGGEYVTKRDDMHRMFEKLAEKKHRKNNKNTRL